MIRQLATALALSCALVTPALAQAISTWRDTEGNVHTETTPNDMAHVRGDPKYRPIIAVARVFYWGFRLINRMVPGSFSVQDENSATLGLDSTTRDPYIVKQFSADYPCQFDLKKGRDNKLAEIHFDRLTDKVEPVTS